MFGNIIKLDKNSTVQPTQINVKNKAFANLEDSLINLVVLLTSSNNPDGKIIEN
jgi:hypothetical protein